MKRVLFLILIVSLFFTACSNLVQNNVIETPKVEDSPQPDSDDFTQPDSSDKASTTAGIDIPSEDNNSINDESDGIIGEPNQALGGGDFTFDRLFIESTCNGAFTDLIVGRDELSKFINEEIEPHKFEKQNLPLIYKIIQHFNIPKETFIEYNNKTIAFNKEHGTEGITFEDYIIEALYCGDIEKMRQTLKSPYALYQNQEFYTIYDLFKMKPEEIARLGLSQEEIISHTNKVFEAMKSCGYDNEVTREYFSTLSGNIQSAQKLINSEPME